MDKLVRGLNQPVTVRRLGFNPKITHRCSAFAGDWIITDCDKIFAPKEFSFAKGDPDCMACVAGMVTSNGAT